MPKIRWIPASAGMTGYRFAYRAQAVQDGKKLHPCPCRLPLDIPGITVTLAKGNASRIAYTSSDGSYSFPCVLEGVYTLTPLRRRALHIPSRGR